AKPAASPATAAAATTPVAPPPTTTTPPPSEPSGGKNKVLAYSLLGVGGAGILTGTITGILALSKKGSLECPDNHCPPSEHDKLDSAKTMATVSTIGFSVGLVSAAAGVVLLMTSGSSEAPPATSAQLGPLRAEPWLGDRALGVRGSF